MWKAYGLRASKARFLKGLRFKYPDFRMFKTNFGTSDNPEKVSTQNYLPLDFSHERR
jgi:hypothetical protein